jgi:hypothetical protein
MCAVDELVKGFCLAQVTTNDCAALPFGDLALLSYKYAGVHTGCQGCSKNSTAKESCNPGEGKYWGGSGLQKPKQPPPKNW